MEIVLQLRINDIMKKLFLLATSVFALFSCDMKQEPIDVIIPITAPNTEAIKAFKSTMESRPVVMSMHYDWGTKSGYSLMNTPDSLDIIVLKNNYSELNDIKLKDLKDVQSLKATKVLTSIDMETVSQKTQKAIEQGYKSKKKAQDAEWAKNNNKPTNEEEVKTAYANIKQEVTKAELEKATAWLGKEGHIAVEGLNKFGFDGLSIRLPQTDDVFKAEIMKHIFEQISKLTGKDKAKMLVIESPVEAYKELVDQANYVIVYSPDYEDFDQVKSVIEKFSSSKLLLSYDVEDKDLGKGYKNNPIFSATGSMSRDKLVQAYKFDGKAGLAIYHSEKYYFEVADYMGFNNPYIPLKDIINGMNAK